MLWWNRYTNKWNVYFTNIQPVSSILFNFACHGPPLVSKRRSFSTWINQSCTEKGGIKLPDISSQLVAWLENIWSHAGGSNSVYQTGSLCHYSDAIMGAMASQITSLTIVYLTVYSSIDQRNYIIPGYEIVGFACVWSCIHDHTCWSC